MLLGLHCIKVLRKPNLHLPTPKAGKQKEAGKTVIGSSLSLANANQEALGMAKPCLTDLEMCDDQLCQRLLMLDRDLSMTR